jgi:hypothetical protein
MGPILQSTTNASSLFLIQTTSTLQSKIQILIIYKLKGNSNVAVINTLNNFRFDARTSLEIIVMNNCMAHPLKYTVDSFLFYMQIQILRLII